MIQIDRMNRALLLSATLFLWALWPIAAHADTPIVVEGHAKAVVVLPDDALPIPEYAADELIYHVEQATGVRLAVHRESDASDVDPQMSRVYIGMTRKADEAGLELEALESEVFVLQSGDGQLIIAGHDGPGDPLSERTTHSGTLWGVYELLEQVLEVRWLWPGDLGTFVPERTSVHVPEMNVKGRPQLERRRVRWNERPAQPGLGFSHDGARNYYRDLGVFMRRHRMGRSAEGFFQGRRPYGHAFSNWWDEYGEEHPEWFMLLEDGSRGPDGRRGGRTSMCVSNTELHREIIRRWEAERASQVDDHTLNICENDLRAYCTCSDCKAWDSPQPNIRSIPKGVRGAYEPFSASTRYARFAQAIYERAVEVDPDVVMTTYAYLNYFTAPSSDVQLNSNIIVGFCPWGLHDGWFPRAPETQAWVKEQWKGWADTGATLFYRPNWFLDGYIAPYIYARQFADIFSFVSENNMIATDFDTLTGQWATQAPNLYLLMRMHSHPSLPADTLLDEYYQAFGPAASHVREYFDYWEAHTTRQRVRLLHLVEAMDLNRRFHFARIMPDLYPARVLNEAATILDAAEAAVRDSANDDYAARVDFLRQGLAHVRKVVAVAAVFEDESTSSARRHDVLNKLISFRRQVEGMNIADLNWAADVENASWQGQRGFQRIEQSVDFVAATRRAIPSLEPAGFEPHDSIPDHAIIVRGNANYALHLEAGQAVNLKITCYQIGNYQDALPYGVVNASGEVIATGLVKSDETDHVRVVAEEVGTITIHTAMRWNGNASIVEADRPLALIGRSLAGDASNEPRSTRNRLNLFRYGGKLYFRVPAELASFEIEVSGKSSTFSKASLIDAQGRTVEVRDGIHGNEPHRFSVSREPSSQDELWALRIEPASEGTFSDVFIEFMDPLPDFLAVDPAALPRQTSVPSGLRD
ncbi:DUF4838 domain-containing protein [Phycisphaerales bacterium AB-hyl4]|uniref:DUF4838 domain-containing protein n=1 Tax=Natronomicrosphaera hydrolytica TaxID=3242702 RepID=A0ABV4U5H4_9BACT